MPLASARNASATTTVRSRLGAAPRSQTDELELVGQRVDELVGGDLALGLLVLAQRRFEIVRLLTTEKIERLEVHGLELDRAPRCARDRTRSPR